MNLPGSDPSAASDAFFPLTANGAGGVTGTISATGYIGASGSAITQSIQGASYSFSNGAGTLTLPTAGIISQSLISGSQLFYVSPDGNFAVGGSTAGYDMFVAVRAASGPFTNGLFSGLYYTAGLDEDNTNVTITGGFLDTYFGALKADGAGTIVRHERLAPFDANAYDWTFDTFYDLTQNGDGTYDRSAFKYGIGASGVGFVGIGKGPVEAL